MQTISIGLRDLCGVFGRKRIARFAFHAFCGVYIASRYCAAIKKLLLHASSARNIGISCHLRLLRFSSAGCLVAPVTM